MFQGDTNMPELIVGIVVGGLVVFLISVVIYRGRFEVEAEYAESTFKLKARLG